MPASLFSQFLNLYFALMNILKIGCCIALSLFTALRSMAQQAIPLYREAIPGAIAGPDIEQVAKDGSSVSKVSVPTLTPFLPAREKANGAAIIICPGGGYHNLVIDREGYRMARRLVKMGIAAFVLKYRLPDDKIMQDKSTGPLQDAQQAIHMVRSQASKWHIDTGKVGVMGFSAGGHLASTIGTHYKKAFINNDDQVNLRPSFLVLIYPVISFRSDIAHIGSRTNLIGKAPDESAIKEFSNDEQVTPETPPTFLIQAEDDSVVVVQNSLRFYEALLKNKVPAAMHLYTVGGHGFGKVPPRDVWMKDLVYWMQTIGVIPSAAN